VDTPSAFTRSPLLSRLPSGAELDERMGAALRELSFLRKLRRVVLEAESEHTAFSEGETCPAKIRSSN
jgi:hypothetical protein